MFFKPVKLTECPCGHFTKEGFEPLTCPKCLKPFPQSGVVLVHSKSLSTVLREEEGVLLAKKSQRTFKKRERTEVVLSSNQGEDWTAEEKAVLDRQLDDFGADE